MGKSSDEKLEFARTMLRQGLGYREIQQLLKDKYGAGVSNSTLQSLQEEIDDLEILKRELERTERELALYKNLYFELLDSLKKRL